MSDRWQHVGEIFHEALAVPAAGRERFVRATGASDEVVDEVLSLLASHDEAGTFLEAPVVVDAPEPLASGTRIGTYQIARVLGQGGMGIVYDAEDLRLHRRVALKSVAPALARDERLRMRLWHEARAAAALSHPNIATVYALEEIDGQVFIASEYIEGRTLREELEEGPLTLAAAGATVRAIASALGAAHARGIVHRDLKPENLMRTVDGVVKVLDFGLAQFDAGARRLVTGTRLTATGLVAGTPPYMAPEQLLGRATDARTDLFALAVVLYEMVAGRHPFEGASMPSTIARILAGEPRPLPERREIPPGLWPVIARGLHRDATERFSSAADLVAALDEVVGASSTALPSSTAASRTPVQAVPSEAGTSPWWWKFHQLAAALACWLIVWPAWHVHDWMGSLGVPFFLLTLIGAIVAGNLRVHLWFTARIYPFELEGQRARVATWVRSGDFLLTGTLVAGGLAIGGAHAGWSALLIAWAIGGALAFLVIEPATARATFGDARGRKAS